MPIINILLQHDKAATILFHNLSVHCLETKPLMRKVWNFRVVIHLPALVRVKQVALSRDP